MYVISAERSQEKKSGKKLKGEKKVEKRKIEHKICSGAPGVGKFGNLCIPEILVVT